jgi:hypothetical protein
MSAYSAKLAWLISQEYAPCRILFARCILIRKKRGSLPP